ncbi:MAG: 30S ribosome-binding factor RbfA [Dehalococcoidia bacterium]
MSRRLQRLNVLLRQEISDLIRRDLRDPRLAEIVSVTRVSTSADLKAATAYVSVMADDEEKTVTMTALERAAPFIRRQLIGRLSIRRTPDVHFELDESMEEASHILDLMKHLPNAGPSGPESRSEP